MHTAVHKAAVHHGLVEAALHAAVGTIAQQQQQGGACKRQCRLVHQVLHKAAGFGCGLWRYWGGRSQRDCSGGGCCRFSVCRHRSIGLFDQRAIFNGLFWVATYSSSARCVCSR